jgi:hypothetical protein
MRLSKKTIFILALTFLFFAFLIYFYILPVATTVYSDMKIYETRTAYRDDYTNFTTPLSKDVVDDICAKLDIEKTSKNCLPGAVVYGPDFFDEIKTYFRSLSNQEKNHNTVQNRLGTYLISCEPPVLNGRYKGYYICKYDLRGDGSYPFYFKFDENDFIIETIANIGGS